MATTVKRTVFNEAQLYLLEVFSRVKTKQELNDLKRVISNYYFKKLESEMEKFESQKKQRVTKTRSTARKK